jgi:hypothetical protein
MDYPFLIPFSAFCNVFVFRVVLVLLHLEYVNKSYLLLHTGVLPSAIPVIQCEDPPMVAHAEAKINGYLPGDVVTYTCIPGYKLSGSEAMECVLGGTWEGSPPVCKSK